MVQFHYCALGRAQQMGSLIPISIAFLDKFSSRYNIV